MMGFLKKYESVLDVVFCVLGLAAGLITVALNAARLLDLLEDRMEKRRKADEFKDYAD